MKVSIGLVSRSTTSFKQQNETELIVVQIIHELFRGFPACDHIAIGSAVEGSLTLPFT
jgi:hypothetical protein